MPRSPQVWGRIPVCLTRCLQRSPVGCCVSPVGSKRGGRCLGQNQGGPLVSQGCLPPPLSPRVGTRFRFVIFVEALAVGSLQWDPRDAVPALDSTTQVCCVSLRESLSLSGPCIVRLLGSLIPAFLPPL